MSTDIINPFTGQVEYSQTLMDRGQVEKILAATQPAYRD